MKRISRIFIIIVLLVFFSEKAEAYSMRHHLINMTRNIIRAGFSPLYGAFIKGPQNIKKAYTYEVWEKEKPEKRGLWRYRFFAFWRTPGEMTKGIIDGLVESIEATGEFLKEFLSIFFSD